LAPALQLAPVSASPVRGTKKSPVRAGTGLGEARLAGSTGFEPAISSVTGWHVRPLHHEPVPTAKDTRCQRGCPSACRVLQTSAAPDSCGLQMVFASSAGRSRIRASVRPGDRTRCAPERGIRDQPGGGRWRGQLERPIRALRKWYLHTARNGGRRARLRSHPPTAATGACARTAYTRPTCPSGRPGSPHRATLQMTFHRAGPRHRGSERT
jgi:hypothetical protein